MTTITKHKEGAYEAGELIGSTTAEDVASVDGLPEVTSVRVRPANEQERRKAMKGRRFRYVVVE